ncbi:MAG: double-CXXCG motif protein [Desulfitobacterium hafniense]|nr:double-CXXCG motif protein [Desulfitobacterium hafniense]
MHEKGQYIPLALSNDYYPDFLWYYIRHISEKAKIVMESERITGYGLERAHIVSVRDLTEQQKKELRHDGIKINRIAADPPAYYKLHVELGAEFHEKAQIILRENCSECGYEDYITLGKDWVDSEKGIFIRKDSWNGKDLFLCKGYGLHIFCTERFADVYHSNGLTGLEFDEVEVL